MQHGVVVLPIDRQPDVAAVDCIFGTPAVGHEDEGVFFSFDGQDEGGLGFEGDFILGVGAAAGVSEGFVGAEDVIGDGQAGGVGAPAGGSGGDEKNIFRCA